MSEPGFVGLKDDRIYYSRIIFFSGMSENKLRMREGETMRGLCGCRGISNFTRSVGLCAPNGGKITRPQVSPVLQGKGHERKEASFLT